MNKVLTALAAADLLGGSCTLALVGQVSPDSLSGGAGWVGTGLLGSVLAWVFFIHLPAKDKQLKEMIEGKDLALDAKDKAAAADRATSLASLAAKDEAAVKDRAEFRKVLEDDRAEFRRVLKEFEDNALRRSKAEDDRIASLVAATDLRGEKQRGLYIDECDRQRKSFAVEMSEMRNLTMQVITSGRTMIHDARDLTTATVNAANLIRQDAAKDGKEGGKP